MTATVLPFPIPPRRPSEIKPQPADVIHLPDRRPPVDPGIVLWSALFAACVQVMAAVCEAWGKA